MDIKTALRRYLDYLEIERGRSPRTRLIYERYLRAFFTHNRIRRIDDLTEERVREFRLHLARLPLKKATQNYYIIAIRNFLRYLNRNDLSPLSPEKIELPKVPQRQIEIIAYSDLERLLTSPAADLRGLRDKAILELFFSTGLRLSELCHLNRNLDLKRGELTVRGKGEKLRVVFLSDAARKAITTYLARRTDTEEALFISIFHNKIIGRISPRAVERLVNYYARKAGITQRITPHGLRHLFATDLLVNGADLRSVQELLGHSNIATTQVYTHLTNKELREVHQAFHARRRK